MSKAPDNSLVTTPVCPVNVPVPVWSKDQDEPLQELKEECWYTKSKVSVQLQTLQGVDHTKNGCLLHSNRLLSYRTCLAGEARTNIGRTQACGAEKFFCYLEGKLGFFEEVCPLISSL